MDRLRRPSEEAAWSRPPGRTNRPRPGRRWRLPGSLIPRARPPLRTPPGGRPDARLRSSRSRNTLPVKGILECMTPEPADGGGDVVDLRREGGLRPALARQARQAVVDARDSVAVAGECLSRAILPAALDPASAMNEDQERRGLSNAGRTVEVQYEREMRSLHFVEAILQASRDGDLLSGWRCARVGLCLGNDDLGFGLLEMSTGVDREPISGRFYGADPHRPGALDGPSIEAPPEPPPHLPYQDRALPGRQLRAVGAEGDTHFGWCGRDRRLPGC